MKKKFTFLLTGLLTLMFSVSAMAQDRTIKAPDFVVEESGILDKLTGCIQNTGSDTRICLGEVDFGEDGSKYSAAGIDFANGWSTDGWAILYAGQDFESASPFVQIALDETNGYQIYYTFVDSMAYLKGPNHDGVFEGAQATFVKPTGVQKVWLTFKDGNGNIRSVKFFENQLQPEDLVQDGDGRPGWWGKSVLRFPSERAGYSEISVKRLSTESTPAVPMGDDSEFKDVRLDGDSWGWTKKGFVADYGEVDFGSGEYDQVVVYVKRDGDSGLSRFLEVYIDEVKDENMIASIWGNLHMKEFYPIAKNIESITGTHRVLVRWTDGGPNLRAVEFSKGAKWEEGLVCGIQIVDELPSDKAFRVKFEGSPEGVAEPWSYEILANGRREDSGNIGYTKNGTVIKLFDSSAADKLIDFGNGYTDIVVDHACDKTWLGEIDDANFSFYLDLDPNGQYSSDDWSNNLSTILSGQEPVARVRIQGTTSWGTRKHVSGEVTGDLSGKHALYIVYNIKNDNSAGANIFNIYFEPKAEGVSVSDLTIKASDFVVEESGILDKLTGCIQSTSTDTRICLGEVDFGEDGSKYSAAGIDFANGWSTDGWAILYAGQDFESASPFVQIALDETNGYQIYYTFVDSMAYLKGPNHDGVFEGAQATFVKPTGVQKVWLTFKDGNGNIRSVKFFENQLQPEDLVQDGDGRPGWWGKSVLRFPSERAGYSEISVKRLSTESTPAVPMGDDSEFKDVRINEETGAWGWLKKGFIADYGDVDFGSGEYDQVIVYAKRDGDPGLSRYFEVYIDEVKDENMIASIWADLHMKEFYPIAKNIESITGTHRVFVKWTGEGPDLKAVEFSKGAKWEEGLVCGIQIVDELPSDKAFRVKFEGSPEGVAEPWSYEILANGRREDSGNIGYTKNGTVIKLFDSSAADKLIDFGNGYTDIVVDHACDKTWLGEIDDANFSFYLDLDPNGQYSSDDWSNNLSTILSGQEPVARVRIQGTTSWGTRKHVSGEVTGDLSGKHALYIVYNIKNDNSAGANIFNIYFEPNGEPTSVQATGAVESVNVFVADGQIIVKAAESVKVATYTLSGVGISETVASAGTNTYDAAPGFYIVKVTDKNGTVTTYKVLVK